MKSENNHFLDEILRKIAEGRKRTNLLVGIEQRTLAYLVQLVPNWVTPNMLTFTGLFGAIVVSASFILSAFFDEIYLLGALLGFAINWFGDSLDGRLAYYRNQPRRWYGFVLDITIDFIGVVFIGFGFIYYAEGFTKILGYLFVVLYAWEFIIILMRFKITGEYTIDSGVFSPTEVRIVLSIIIILEILIKNSIYYFAGLACIAILIANFLDTNKLLKKADEKDKINK